MIPLRDTARSKHYPLITYSIIVLNVFVFLIEQGQGQRLPQFLMTYGLVPARLSAAWDSGFGQYALTFFTFMFLHGSFWHLLGNMWSLYIFGDNVEDKLGPVHYLLFYLVAGIGSGLFHAFVNLGSQIPTIGASGAIAGVMGAYIILYPGARILTLIPIFFLPYFVEIPAFVFLGIWFLFQFMSAAGPAAQKAGIAWWAHIAGFVLGMIFLKIFLTIPGSGGGISRKA
jgi:hypothetical protein